MKSNAKYLYIIDYWVPFPESEYGGLINLIAENDQGALELLTDEMNQQTIDYPEQCLKNIISAQKLMLTGDYENGIIEVFCT